MRNIEQAQAEKYVVENKKKKRWLRCVSVLAAIAVFCTVYVLIMPAITWERSLICQIPEHHHSEACYEMVTVPAEKELICQVPEHVHGPECYERTLICLLEESKGHTHGEACFIEYDELVCTLEESEEHTHSEACFSKQRELICNLEESEGHIHSETCYEENLICCELEHTHCDGCFNIIAEEHEESAIVCGLAEHEHTQACFDAPPAEDDGYCCGHIAHTHSEEQHCFFSDGTLRCTIPEHVHSWTCIRNVEPFELIAYGPDGIRVSLKGNPDSLPYPADEVTLQVRAVDDARVERLLERSDYSECESLALDITLWHGSEEIQPEGDVSLSFIGISGAENDNTQVLHIEPETSKIEEMDSCAENGIVSLETNHFSIYVVSVPIHTYEFYVDGKLAAKQSVKSGEKLLHPETPGKENHKFQGWSKNSSGGAPYFEDFGVKSTVETGTTKLYADFSEVYYVFFMQPNVGTDTYKVFQTKEGVSGNTVSTTDISFKIDDSHELVGWSLTEGGTTPVSSVQISNNDITLYPIIEEGCWITFETQTADSYVKPVYYRSSQSTVAPKQPTRAGYTFKYWSTQPDGSAYVFGNKLSSSITLYAVWEAQLVNYTVIHWIENANYWDSDDGASGVMQPDVIDTEEYSFGSTEKKQGYSGANTAAAADTSTYPSNLWVPQTITQKVIDGHGDTIINVYYKRMVFTINLQIGTSVLENDKINGGKQIYDVNGVPFTITAKWGANASYLWPDQRNEQFDFQITTSDIGNDGFPAELKKNNAHNGTRYYKGLSKDVFPAGSMWQILAPDNEPYGWYDSCFTIMPAENSTYYYLGLSPEYRISFDFMVEPLPEETDDGTWKVFDNKSYKPKLLDTMCSDHPWWSTTTYSEFEGFTYTFNLPADDYFAMYWRDAANAEYVDKGYITWTPQNVPVEDIVEETVYYLYSRNKYKIHFFSQGTEIMTINDVYYERDISNTSYTPPDRTGYSFEGWYSDEEAIGAPYSFEGKIMPAKDITLYAKWVPETVTVRFFNDSANPVLLSERTYSIGDVIDSDQVPSVSRDDERFVYWMAENSSGELEPFNMSTYLDADVDLYPHFVPDGKYVVTYNLNDTYAKKIVGEAVKGSAPVDTQGDGYNYGSYAEIMLLPNNLTIPEGLVFLHWNTAADDSGAEYNPQEKLFIDHDYTLYAIWGPDPTAQTTYLTYHSNRDDGNPENKVVTDLIPVNDELTISDNPFEYPGHTFIGWNTKADGSGTWWSVGTAARLDGDGTENNLYAIWENAGVLLPNTGGIGVYPVYAMGVFIIANSIMYGFAPKRKREGQA